jgi:hypothetical protein
LVLLDPAFNVLELVSVERLEGRRLEDMQTSLDALPREKSRFAGLL